MGGVPRCRVLRFRRDRGSDCGLVPGVGAEAEPGAGSGARSGARPVAGTVGAGDTDDAAVTADRSGASAAAVGFGVVGECRGGSAEEDVVLAPSASLPRMRMRAEAPVSSASVSSAGGVADAGAAGAEAAADPARGVGGLVATERRSVGVRGRCGCTPRGGAGVRCPATGRGVGALCRAGASAAGVWAGRELSSSSSSQGFAGMAMPPVEARSARAPEDDGAPSPGRTTRGALMSPVKLAIRPWESGSCAIPVGRSVTA